MLATKNNAYDQFMHTQDLDSSIGLLCWNLHKENLSFECNDYLQQLLEKENLDLLALQEFKYAKTKSTVLREYSYATAINIQTFQYGYGLLSASKAACYKKIVTLSKDKEFLFTTQKMFLVTRYRFQNTQKPLTLINIHAINFVPYSHFYTQLQQLNSFLHTLEDAVILCGDFNSWSTKRLQTLEYFESFLGFKKAAINNQKDIKRIFNKPIDHIFYKGIDLEYAYALNSGKLSDHNPIIARFSQQL